MVGGGCRVEEVVVVNKKEREKRRRIAESKSRAAVVVAAAAAAFGFEVGLTNALSCCLLDARSGLVRQLSYSSTAPVLPDEPVDLDASGARALGHCGVAAVISLAGLDGPN